MPGLMQPSFAPNDNFQGVGDFVSALTGGRSARTQGYRAEMNDITSLESRLAEAMMRKRQNEAQARITAQALSESGLIPEAMSPLAADLFVSGMGTNASVNDNAAGLGKLFELGSRRNAQVLAHETPERYTPENAELIGLENGLVPTAKVDGGQVFTTPYGPNTTFIPTPTEQARAGALLAQSAQRQASADASQARADVYRRTDPNQSRGGKPKAEASKPAGKVPAVGAVMDGYRFKGGDPANPKSWEKV